MQHLSVIGAGAWGTALANMAARAGWRVSLWMRDEVTCTQIKQARENTRYLPGISLHDAVAPTTSLQQAAQADAILLVVPAQSMASTVATLLPHLGPDVPLIICAKGIERDTGLFLSERLQHLTSTHPVGVLSGPGFADDVARGLPTAVVLAFPQAELSHRLAQQLSGSTFRVYHHEDVRGVEIGGALKNVLAIACGIVSGRKMGESARAALMARGFSEMMRFAKAYGAQPETLMGLSGLGDVVLSCASSHSRNFAFGERLGQGLTLLEAQGGKLTEGFFTTQAVMRLAKARGIDMPIMQAVYGVLQQQLTIDQAIDTLMSRSIKRENDTGLGRFT